METHAFRFHPYRVRYTYRDPVDQLRARMVLIFGLGAAVISLLGGAALAAGLFDISYVLTPLLLCVMVAVNVALVQTGRLFSARVLLLGGIFLVIASGLYLNGIASMVMPLAVVVVFAAFLMGTTGGVVALIIGLIMVGITAYAQAFGIVSSEGGLLPLVTSVLLGVLALAWVAVFFSANLEQTLRRTGHTASQLKAVIRTGEVINIYDELDPLLRQSVALIREQFGFYHARLFLLEPESNVAVLKAGTGRVGRRMMAGQARIVLDSQVAVGRAALFNEPVLTHHADVLFQPDPLLPDARTILALPLQAGDAVVGVLELQSTEEDAFSPVDVESLQAMVNQLAGTVRRIREADALAADLAACRQELGETQAHLAEVERQNHRLTGQAWQDYLSSRGADTAGFDWDGGALRVQRAWTPGLLAAMSTTEGRLRQEGDRQILTVPIRLRGTPVGAMEFSSAEVRWDQNAQDLAEEAIRRLEAALESARLFENSQRLAERERLLGTVSAKLQGASDMEGMLSLAAAEIRQALGAGRVTVRLSTELDEMVLSKGED